MLEMLGQVFLFRDSRSSLLSLFYLITVLSLFFPDANSSPFCFLMLDPTSFYFVTLDPLFLLRNTKSSLPVH